MGANNFFTYMNVNIYVSLAFEDTYYNYYLKLVLFDSCFIRTFFDTYRMYGKKSIP